MKCFWITLLLFFLPLLLRSQEDSNAVAQLINIADSFYQNKNYEIALQKANQAEGFLKLWQMVPFDLANRKNAILADIAYATADYIQVVHYDSLQLLILQDRYKANSLEVANHLSMMASTELKLERNEKALKYNQKAEAIYRDSSELYPTQWASSLRALGTNYFYLGDFEKWGAFYKKALSIYENQSDPNQNSLAFLYRSLASYNSIANSDFKAALSFNLKALRIYTTQDTLTYSFSDCLNKIGLAHENLGEYNKALFYYYRAFSINNIIYPPDHPELATSLENIAYVHTDKLKDFPSALTLYQEQETILLKKLGAKHHLTQRAKYNIAKTLHFLNEHEMALEKIDELLTNQSSTDDVGMRITISYLTTRAVVYKSMNKPDKALSNLFQALRFDNSITKDNRIQVSLLYNIANVYLSANENENALKFQRQAQELYENIFGKNHEKTIRSKMLQAEIFKAEGKTEAALNLLNELIHKETSTLELNAGNNMNSPYLLIDLYETKSIILEEKYKLEGRVDQLIEAANMISLLTQLRNEVQKSYHLNSSREWIIQKSLKTLDRGINVNYQLYEHSGKQKYLDKAYKYIQQSKGSLLLHLIQNSKALTFSNIPDSVTQKLIKLNLKATQHLTKNNEEVTISLEEQQIIRKTRIAYIDLLNTVENKFPEYYKLKYKIPEIEIREIQYHLARNNAVLIDYEFTDSLLYACFISPDTMFIQPIRGPNNIKEKITNLQTIVKSFTKYKDQEIEFYKHQAQSFCDISFQLYSTILGDLQTFIPLEKNLIIIPNEELNYLPFELLLTEYPVADFHAFSNHPYLIKKHAISYGVSIPVLLEMITKSPSPYPNEFLSVAPSFDSSHSHTPLVYNQNEAQAIAKIWKGTFMSGQGANKSSFLKIAEDQGLIHLATHGGANLENGNKSYISFQPASLIDDQYLYAKEIYGLSLPLNQLTISACETASGELIPGEGMIGLNRSIAYAGTKRIVSSYWNVDDQATHDLMIDYNQHLRKGFSATQALQKSKLNYLDKTLSDQYAHPFYWSGFVLSGDPSRIEIESFKTNFILLFLLISSGLLLIAILKKNNLF